MQEVKITLTNDELVTINWALMALYMDEDIDQGDRDKVKAVMSNIVDQMQNAMKRGQE